MDGRKDPLNDAALEQEIEALLSVEPSPGFVARVRSRVADEATSSGWGWRWPIAAVSTAIAVTVIGVAVWRPMETTTPSARAPAIGPAIGSSAADVPGPVVTPPREAPVVVPAHHDVRRVIAAPRHAIDMALPAVIIAENETRAFAVLMRSAPTTQFDFTPLVAPSPGPLAVDKMPKMDPVVIDPIVIRPLAGATAE